MSLPTTSLRRRVLVTATAAAFALSLPLAGLTSASTGGGGIKPHTVSVKPTYTRALKAAAASRFDCQDVRPGHPLCYSPQQIQTAYQIAPLLKAGINGKK